MYRLLLTTFILSASLIFCSQMVMAQKQATTHQDCGCWFNSKTGQQVPSGPANHGTEVDLVDPNRAFNPATGNNYHRQPNGCWFNSKNGQQVPSGPANPGTEVNLLDSNRAFNPATGNNYHRGPCPPPAKTAAKDTATKKIKDKTIGSTNFQRNELFVGFSLIREDNGSSGFNTYGGQLAYTRNLCWRGGLTGDVGINLGNNGGIDYTKFSVLAGGTYYPIKTAVPASNFSFSIHALGGLSTIRSSYSGNSNSNSFFTLDVGVGFNYYFSHKLGLGLRTGYMPTFNKGNTSNNMRIALGLDFR